MMLIGQYDSPFVRRVAIALTTYGVAFEHKPWSTFGDAEQIAEFNPLRRVLTLVLKDGTVLIDSLAILETIDETVGHERAVLNRHAAERRDLLRIASFAAGVADKGVSLLYERVLREAIFPMWVARCRAQIMDTLDLLEKERAGRTTPLPARRGAQPCRCDPGDHDPVRLRGAQRGVRLVGLAGAQGALGALRSPAGVQGDLAAL